MAATGATQVQSADAASSSRSAQQPYAEGGTVPREDDHVGLTQIAVSTAVSPRFRRQEHLSLHVFVNKI